VPEGIAAAIDGIEIDASVVAAVVMGAGRTFIAGADIKELERAASGGGSEGPELHGLLQRIEDCSKPVVMAIHGTALGGGLEVAMAGHFRVAVPDAQMGQPEVNLASFPEPKARSGCRAWWDRRRRWRCAFPASLSGLRKRCAWD